MLARIIIVIIILFVVMLQAAIISVMKDSAKGDSRLFQRWLINWAIVVTAITLAIYYIVNGTLPGVK